MCLCSVLTYSACVGEIKTIQQKYVYKILLNFWYLKLICVISKCSSPMKRTHNIVPLCRSVIVMLCMEIMAVYSTSLWKYKSKMICWSGETGQDLHACMSETHPRHRQGKMWRRLLSESTFQGTGLNKSTDPNCRYHLLVRTLLQHQRWQRVCSAFVLVCFDSYMFAVFKTTFVVRFLQT